MRNMIQKILFLFVILTFITFLLLKTGNAIKHENSRMKEIAYNNSHKIIDFEKKCSTRQYLTLDEIQEFEHLVELNKEIAIIISMPVLCRMTFYWKAIGEITNNCEKDQNYEIRE